MADSFPPPTEAASLRALLKEKNDKLIEGGKSHHSNSEIVSPMLLSGVRGELVLYLWFKYAKDKGQAEREVRGLRISKGRADCYGSKFTPWFLGTQSFGGPPIWQALPLVRSTRCKDPPDVVSYAVKGPKPRITMKSSGVVNSNESEWLFGIITPAAGKLSATSYACHLIARSTKNRIGVRLKDAPAALASDENNFDEADEYMDEGSDVPSSGGMQLSPANDVRAAAEYPCELAGSGAGNPVSPPVVSPPRHAPFSVSTSPDHWQRILYYESNLLPISPYLHARSGPGALPGPHYGPEDANRITYHDRDTEILADSSTEGIQEMLAHRNQLPPKDRYVHDIVVLALRYLHQIHRWPVPQFLYQLSLWVSHDWDYPAIYLALALSLGGMLRPARDLRRESCQLLQGAGSVIDQRADISPVEFLFAVGPLFADRVATLIEALAECMRLAFNKAFDATEPAAMKEVEYSANLWRHDKGGAFVALLIMCVLLLLQILVWCSAFATVMHLPRSPPPKPSDYVPAGFDTKRFPLHWAVAVAFSLLKPVLPAEYASCDVLPYDPERAPSITSFCVAHLSVVCSVPLAHSA